MIPFFSIIIPVFNVQDYIGECLDSILTQSFTNFEVICVNDGSVDNSLDVLNSYTDKRLKIINQANQGPSKARNTAIDKSSGEYIWFVDADDKISSDCLGRLFECTMKGKYPAVFFNADVFFDNDRLAEKGWFKYIRTCSGEYNVQHFFEHEVFNNTIMVSPCCYIFNKNFFHGIKFIENIYHEDNSFFIELVFKYGVYDCYVIQESFFLRRVRDNSIMTIQPSTQHLYGYIESLNHLHNMYRVLDIKNGAYERFTSTITGSVINLSNSLYKSFVPYNIRLKLLKLITLKGLSYKLKLAIIFPEIYKIYVIIKNPRKT